LTPDLANSSALAMRRRHLCRRRIVRVATVAYHAAAAVGVAFIVAIVLGLVP
jgi:hypothetical protein